MPHLSPIVWFFLFGLVWFYLLLMLLFIEFSLPSLNR